MKKKTMRRKFGKSDLEHLAAAIYATFHGEVPDNCAWEYYKKLKGDPVVENFRWYAEQLCDSALYDAEYKGLGRVYYTNEDFDEKADW